MTTPINELELQRCVDGELPALERRNFLERVETTPAGWKTLALAFLENQDFDAAGVEFRQSAPASPATLASNTPTIPRRTPVWAVRSLGLAASVAVAFWIGRQGGQPASHDSADENGSIASQTYAPEQSLANGQRGVMKPAATLEFPISGEGNEALTIPVYDRQTLANEGPEIPLWPDFSRKNSLSQPPGYRLTSERNLISIPLETGETVYVPVEVSGVRYAVQ
jgi:hypothetical protein